MLEADVNLSSRTKAVRDKALPRQIKTFTLEEIKQHFDESLLMIQQQFDIAQNFLRKDNLAEAQYIWRTQIVLLESAYDFYMHEIVKFGLYKMYEGDLNKTEKYENLKVDMKTLLEALNNQRDDSKWFLEFINRYYSMSTLASYDSFKRLCGLLGIERRDIEKTAFYDRNSREPVDKKLERVLKELFDRRNRIAHQYDREHADAELQTIQEESVQSFFRDVPQIVNAIYEEMKKKCGSSLK